MEQSISILDKPANKLLVKLDWEKAFYITFIILALVTRLWALGDRVQSHDESIHTKYSWHLYTGQGFSHHPLMHGPFLFHITALSYFFFGDNDFSARVPVALMGVAIVAFPYLLRRWLGRKGALVTSFFLLISPSISYYSRYIRHDTPEMLWALIVIFSFLSYLRDGHRRWLFLMAAGVSLMFATKEVAFIYAATSGLFLVGLFVVQILKPKWPNENFKIWFLAALAVLVVGLLLIGMGQAFQPQPPEDEMTTEAVDEPSVPEDQGATLPWDVVKVGGGLLSGAGLLAAVGLLLAGTLEQSDIEFATPWTFGLLAIMAIGLFVLGINDWLGVLFSKSTLPQPQLALLSIWSRVTICIILFAIGISVLFSYLSRRGLSTQQLFIAVSITAVVTTGVLIRIGLPLLLSYTTCSPQPNRWECTQQSLQAFGWPSASTYLLDTRFLLTVLPFIGGILVGLAWLAVTAFRSSRAFDLSVLLGSLALPFLSPLLMILAGLKPLDYNSPTIYYTGAILIQVLLVSIAIGLMWDLRQQRDGKRKNSWLIAAGIHYAIYVVLFTTFLTNAYGLASGFVGSLGYWLEQQEVERGSQPEYYYVIMTLLYEFLPLLLSLIAPAYLVVRGLLIPGLQPKIKRLAEFPAVKEYLIPFTLWWVAMSWIGYSIAGERMPWLTVHLALPMIVLSGWLVGRLIEEIDWQRVWRGKAWLLALLAPALVIAIAILVSTIVTNLPKGDEGAPVAQLRATVRLTIGLVALLGTLVCGVGLGYTIKRGSRQTKYILLLAFATLLVILISAIGNLFQGYQLTQLQTSGRFVNALIGLLACSIGLGFLIWHSGGRTSACVLLLIALLVPVFITIRTAWRFNFVTYDYPTEFLVYAHAAPGVRQAMEEVEEISQRYGGGPYAIDVPYGADASTLFHWQLRHYPPDYSFGENPTRDQLDAPVIIAGSAQWTAVDRYVSGKYIHKTYNYIWWPMQDYWNLYSIEEDLETGRKYFNWDRIKYAITNPDMRAALWDIWYNRDFTRYDEATGKTHTLDDWPLRGQFRLYIRHDVAEQVWDLSPEASGAIAPVDPYTEGWRDITARQVITGKESMPFNNPRGITIGPDGFLYVADTSNHRIQKLTLDGEHVASWSQNFVEPWDVGMASDGSIYVADTWNHRIMQLDADGAPMNAWGAFGEHTGGGDVGQGEFYGPRGVVVGTDGSIYVADTGNKRVQVFDPAGQFTRQWGGGGALAGYLDEPVGIDIGPKNEIHVADTWNRRVQVFTTGGVALREWPIEGWDASVDSDKASMIHEEKPYLAVDTNGYVYVTDPSSYRVLVFDSQGNYTLSFGKYGSEENAFLLPSGIDVADDGTIYVSDAAGDRIMVFDPLDLEGTGITSEFLAPALAYPADGDEIAGGIVPLLGTGAPGAEIHVLIDAVSAGSIEADEQGFWYVTVELSEPGEHTISLQAIGPGGAALSSAPVTVIVAESDESLE